MNGGKVPSHAEIAGRLCAPGRDLRTLTNSGAVGKLLKRELRRRFVAAPAAAGGA
jgi:hypothetical protein